MVLPSECSIRDIFSECLDESKQTVRKHGHSHVELDESSKLKEEVYMRKIAVLMAALLIAGLAAPASAAVSWGGKVNTSIGFHKDNLDTPGTFNARQEVVLSPSISAQDISIALDWQTEVNALSDNTVVHDANGLFRLKAATVTLKGALVDGGKELTTTIGDFKIGNIDKKGVRIEGMEFEGINSSAYLLFNGQDAEYRADFKKSEGQVTGDATVSYVTGDVKYVANGKVALSDALTGRAGVNNVSNVNYVGANMKAQNGLELDGQYNTDETYAVKGSMVIPYDYSPVVTVGYANKGAVGSGINVGAKAVVDGVNVAANWDEITHETVIKAGAGALYEKGNLYHKDRPFGYIGKAVVGAEKTLSFDGRFDVTNALALANASIAAVVDIDANSSDNGFEFARTAVGVEANTVTDVAMLKSVELGGKALVDLMAADPQYEAWAGYQMPNGINIDVAYGNTDKVAGFTAIASKVITF